MAWVAPVVGGAASLAGAAVGGKGAKKAADTQLQANREALGFQREQAAKAEAAYKQQWDAWNSSRQALLQRYGIDIAPPQMGQAPSGAPSGPPGGAPGGLQAGPPPGMDAGQPQVGAAPMAGGMPGYKGMTLGELMMRNPSQWAGR